LKALLLKSVGTRKFFIQHYLKHEPVSYVSQVIRKMTSVINSSW
jgi:hypothetical protein